MMHFKIYYVYINNKNLYDLVTNILEVRGYLVKNVINNNSIANKNHYVIIIDHEIFEEFYITHNIFEFKQIICTIPTGFKVKIDSSIKNYNNIDFYEIPKDMEKFMKLF